MQNISMFVGWFLQNFTSEDISVVQLILTLGLAGVVSVYIFFIYRMIMRKNVYSLRYNIMVSAMVLIITAIIFTIQSSVVISLGVMGALSIVRFRTAIKDSLDIVFLFWAVTAGICIGAHMSEIAIMLSAFVTILIFFLEEMSIKRKKKILLVELKQGNNGEHLLAVVKQLCKSYIVKMQDEKHNKMVIELQCKDEYGLFKEINRIPETKSISLLSQEGEKCF